MTRLEALFSADKVVRNQYAALTGRIAKENSAFQTLESRLTDAQGAAERRRDLQTERDEIYRRVFEAVINEQNALTGLYAPLLARLSGAERTIVDAARLLSAPTLPTRRRSAGFRVKFKTKVARHANAVTIDFDFRRRGRLPNRIKALIGYNGTGKTRLLSNLAIVASGYGYGSKEDVLDDTACRFVNTAPPFKTVMVVSYSAFDTFVIPGRTEEEKERLQERGEIFGYVYCGLRERLPARRISFTTFSAGGFA